MLNSTSPETSKLSDLWKCGCTGTVDLYSFLSSLSEWMNEMSGWTLAQVLNVSSQWSCLLSLGARKKSSLRHRRCPRSICLYISCHLSLAYCSYSMPSLIDGFILTVFCNAEAACATVSRHPVTPVSSVHSIWSCQGCFTFNYLGIPPWYIK